MKILYLIVNLSSVSIPLIFSFHPKLKFHKEFKFALPAIVITATIFIIWDILFTVRGIWGFNKNYITGIYLFNLPIEEIMFFLCIPFACLFTYHCINILFRIRWPFPVRSITVLVLSLVLIITGILFRSRLYTSSVFLSTALLLAGINFKLKARWMGNFFTVYAILIFPFLIVNGILTGSGPDEPVVWYNNLEITGLRIFTIPIEDFVYSLELILLNVFFYELLQKRWGFKRLTSYTLSGESR